MNFIDIFEKGLVSEIYRNTYNNNNNKKKLGLKMGKRFEYKLSQVVSKLIKRCSASLATVSCHFMCTRIAKIKKTDNDRC